MEYYINISGEGEKQYKDLQVETKCCTESREGHSLLPFSQHIFFFYHGQDRGVSPPPAHYPLITFLVISAVWCVFKKCIVDNYDHCQICLSVDPGYGVFTLVVWVLSQTPFANIRALALFRCTAKPNKLYLVNGFYQILFLWICEKFCALSGLLQTFNNVIDLIFDP